VPTYLWRLWRPWRLCRLWRWVQVGGRRVDGWTGGRVGRRQGGDEFWSSVCGVVIRLARYRQKLTKPRTWLNSRPAARSPPVSGTSRDLRYRNDTGCRPRPRGERMSRRRPRHLTWPAPTRRGRLPRPATATV